MGLGSLESLSASLDTLLLWSSACSNVAFGACCLGQTGTSIDGGFCFYPTNLPNTLIFFDSLSVIAGDAMGFLACSIFSMRLLPHLISATNPLSLVEIENINSFNLIPCWHEEHQTGRIDLDRPATYLIQPDYEHWLCCNTLQSQFVKHWL